MDKIIPTCERNFTSLVCEKALYVASGSLVILFGAQNSIGLRHQQWQTSREDSGMDQFSQWDYSKN